MNAIFKNESCKLLTYLKINLILKTLSFFWKKLNEARQSIREARINYTNQEASKFFLGPCAGWGVFLR